MFYYTYVLRCLKNGQGSFYTGFSKNLQKRINKHFKKEINSTKKFDKIELVYYEACLNKSDAEKRETQLKTGFGRGYLKRRLSGYLYKRV